MAAKYLDSYQQNNYVDNAFNTDEEKMKAAYYISRRNSTENSREILEILGVLGDIKSLKMAEVSL
jgi:hypothetical protein